MVILVGHTLLRVLNLGLEYILRGTEYDLLIPELPRIQGRGFGWRVVPGFQVR